MVQPNSHYEFERFSSIRRYLTFDFFRHDPSWVIYAADISGQFNLWRQRSYLTEDEPYYSHQLTSFIDEAVNAVFPSPIDNTIVFFADYQGNENYQIYSIDAFNGWPQRLTQNSNAKYEWGKECFSHDGQCITYSSNEQNLSDMHLYIKDIKQQAHPVRITDRPGWYIPSYWSPDNKKITCSQVKTDIESTIWLLDIENKEKMRKITLYEDERSLNTPGPWSIDGQGFYFLTNSNDEYTYVAFYDISNLKIECVINTKWDIEYVELSKDGGILVYIVNENGYSKLYKKNLKTNETQQISLQKNGVIKELKISPNCKKVGFLMGTATSPFDVYTMDLETEQLEKLTNANLGNIPEDIMVEPESIRYKSFDGLQVPALLYKPRNVENLGKKIGAVLLIHGGPVDQERPAYSYEGLYQYLVSRNIAVLAPNFRGSTGYGKNFKKKIFHDWGGNELKDFEYAAKWLLSQQWIDGKKLGVCGSSYGGFGVLSCLARLPHYWKAGVDIFGPSNLITTTTTAPAHWRHSDIELIGDPEKEQGFLKKRSPITYIDNINADLLIIHGANDPKVVKYESDQIVARLRSIGRNVEYMVLDDEGHGFTKYANMIKANKITAEFLMKRLS